MRDRLALFIALGVLEFSRASLAASTQSPEAPRQGQGDNGSGRLIDTSRLCVTLARSLAIGDREEMLNRLRQMGGKIEASILDLDSRISQARDWLDRRDQAARQAN